MILEDIVNHKKNKIKQDKKLVPLNILEKQAGLYGVSKGFLKKTDRVQLIAEIKKASPSKGVIREDFEPVKLAKMCVDAGASALSVLTEDKYFLGSLENLKNVQKAVNKPILRKDFIIDEYQIVESRANGADAVLLIANILNEYKLSKFMKLINDLGMQSLTEVHSEDEVKKVLDVGANIIGINNRDLKTFKTDIRNTEKLVQLIPENKIKVSESGIFSAEDVRYLKKIGIDAILVGEAIMASKDISAKITELINYDKS